MSWLNNYPCYIDPKLKSVDKDFFSACERLFVQENVQFFSKIEELSSYNVSCIRIVSDHMAFEDDAITIRFQQKNLDLFSTDSEKSQDVFCVDDIEELKLLLPLIKEIVLLEKRNLIDRLINSTQTFLKKELKQRSDDGQKDYELAPLKEFSLHELYNQELDYYLYCGPHEEDASFFLKEDIKPHFEYFLSRKQTLDNNFETYHLKKEVQKMTSILDYVSVPVVQFDTNGQILLFNQGFSQLALTQRFCQELKNLEQITVQNHVYKVYLIEGDSKILFFFQVDDLISDSKKPGQEELGIITSSIAHELNNPLGGVLAAIDVLCLDDISDSVNENLETMKESLERCRKLVQTFLGFSKVRLDKADDQDKFSLESCIESAIELTRFRLIENNFKCNYSMAKQASFQGNVNKHIMAMLYYLIINELLTEASHSSLVKREDDVSLEFNFYEDVGRIILKLEEDISIDDFIKKNILLNHLLDRENLTLIQRGRDIRMSYL